LEGAPLNDTETRLLRAFDNAFGERLKERVFAKYPSMSIDEFECRLFELKRYFLLSSLLRSTPMFSDEVDDIWHEMLMFTREYEQFGTAFIGMTVHHAPSAGKDEQPGERAWFDWLYAHLFEVTPFSARLWHGFCRYPLDRERLAFLAEADPAAIRQRWFHERRAEAYPDIGLTIDHLIGGAKEEIRYAEEQPRFQENRFSDGFNSTLLSVSAGMLFFSLMDSGSFDRNMDQLTGSEEESLRRPDDRTTSCSASACSGDSGSGGSNCSSDSGSGGSNCSSGSDGGSSSSCSSSSGSSCSSSSCGSSS
jgi:hypothetical protein